MVAARERDAHRSLGARRDGVVELSGHVETFVEKPNAEHVALSVKA